MTDDARIDWILYPDRVDTPVVNSQHTALGETFQVKPWQEMMALGATQNRL